MSESCEAVFATKAEKDRLQAIPFLEVLIEGAPDGLAAALSGLVLRGKGWADKLNRALKRCEKGYPAVVAYLRELEGAFRPGPVP